MHVGFVHEGGLAVLDIKEAQLYTYPLKEMLLQAPTKYKSCVPSY